MLCNLAVRLVQDGSCKLRASGKAALGPSGTGGRDVKHYPDAGALLSELKALGLGPDVASAATRVISDSEARKRFITFADDLHVALHLNPGFVRLYFQ